MFVVLPNAFGDAATNMAIDTALLETLPEGTAVFRHYGWAEPSFTFGYSQRCSEVLSHTPPDVTLCRRLTGGGIVDHRNDWTYALVIARKAPPAEISSTVLYAAVHKSLSGALNAQSIETQLAPCPRKCDETTTRAEGPDQCFIQPVMNDVLNWEGRKIAGAAMKKTRQGLLIQGSMDRSALSGPVDLNAFSEEFIKNLSQSLEIPRQQPDDLRPFFQSSLIEREKEKFASQEWTHRR
ncbi:hypothetical protein DDZ13_02075 [Coraliomargarita sinensis]|uniref:BPL/LPL catalytic domain-containing protein n=1 Tax=Coraliomargarita sinensis TaxID=2174842 RepID=A0A317ZKY2_9BACT|nr:lipoate--protein ligase family protein [Coraliomargarita sinensis]PXA05682.1 hypothetical protein DDZ13_02075 [Coraliomargarita sinensis]